MFSDGTMMRRLGWFLLGVLLTIAGMALLVPTFLRHRGDWPFERAFAEVAKEMAIPKDAASVQPPRPINDRRTINQGREVYTGSCAVCHGASGDGHGAFGASLYPDATDLRSHDTQEKSDGQLFWIIKNGLSFGGMPAFAEQYPDDTIWSLVGYTRALAEASTAAPGALAVPTPTSDELAFADPHSTDPSARGAAVYFAQACAQCHGPVGDAPGDLAIGPGRDSVRSAQEFEDMLRKPDAAMPIRSASDVSTQEAQDLLAYIQTFPPYRKS